MGNCQKNIDSQKELKFDTQLPKRTLSYQKLNKAIIFEFSYTKYHHPIPILINHQVEKPPKYYKNQIPPDIIPDKFTDKFFPPNTYSLEYISNYNKNFVDSNEIKQFKNLIWKRVKDIFGENKYDLFNTLDVDDVKQGIIGNCYFLCVLSSFAKRPEIYDKIIIDKKINPNGLYKLRFIINGIPQIIYVDDYFPTLNQKFAFAQSPNEFWVQLLEKAWAKINLSYANTISGIPYEVFNCLSEAPCENISHEKNSIYVLWKELLRAKEYGYYITCNTKYLSKEQEDNEGLISGHSYAVIDLFEFNMFYKKGTISESNYKKNNSNNLRENNYEDNNSVLRIMKIYNPWAYFEWKGKFNDNDEKSWNRIPLLKKLVGYNNNDDGIFFMEFKDYYKKFHSTYILNYLKDWIYNYKIINQKNSNYFTCVRVILNKENKIRFGVHVKQSRINLMEKSIELYPVLLIIVKYEIKTNQYKLINNVYDITDNLYSTYHKVFEPGEYHIFMHFNADSNRINDFTYTLSTYSQEKVELLDFTENQQIPNNYLYQIINEYILINEKEFDTNNNEVIFYFDNGDNKLGFYFIYIENKSNFDYFIQFNFDNINCKLIQDEFIFNYFYENSINNNESNINKFYNKFSKMRSYNQILNYYLKQGENKIFIWKLNGTQKNSKLNLINYKFTKSDEHYLNNNNINISFFENFNKYEMIINICNDLEKVLLSPDLEYSEVENIEYIFLIIKNKNREKSFVIEMTFLNSIGLKLELIKKDDNKNFNDKDKIISIILYPEKIQIIPLKKEKLSSKTRYDFMMDYSILDI